MAVVPERARLPVAQNKGRDEEESQVICSVALRSLHQVKGSSMVWCNSGGMSLPKSSSGFISTACFVRGDREVD